MIKSNTLFFPSNFIILLKIANRKSVIYRLPVFDFYQKFRKVTDLFCCTGKLRTLSILNTIANPGAQLKCNFLLLFDVRFVIFRHFLYRSNKQFMKVWPRKSY